MILRDLRFLLQLCVLMPVLASALDAEQMPELRAPQSSYTFPAHQTLTYSVDWRVFPAGTAVLHLEADGDREKVSATADTIGAITMLYRVSDKYQSSFDRKSGCSYGFAKQIIQGRRQISTDLRFDYAQKKSTLDEKNLVTGSTKHQEAVIPPCVTDLLSAIFYAASQPMEVGKSFQMPVGDSIKTIPVTMKVEAKEEIITPLGKYQTLRVQPTADEGVVKNRGNIWIWYTDDERHTPVQMRARLFWGTITFPPYGQRSEIALRLLNAISFAHEPLQPRLVDQVVRQFFVRKHGQRGAATVRDHAGGLVNGEARILAQY